MGARSFHTMVPMRDGTRLNTFVFLPENGGPRFPVILHRTPYGIAAAGARDKFDHTNAWLPSAAEPMRGSILRGWRNIDRSKSRRRAPAASDRPDLIFGSWSGKKFQLNASRDGQALPCYAKSNRNHCCISLPASRSQAFRVDRH